MANSGLPEGTEVTVVGEDELQRLSVTSFPSGPQSDAFFASIGPSDYWNNLLKVVVDARTILAEIMGVMPDGPPDPTCFVPFSTGWYAATCWSYADALLLRDDATLEHKLAWSQMLGAMMAEWDWRLNYKGHIIRGAKVQKAASKGGKQRNRELAPEIAKLLAFMNKFLPDHTLKYAAEQAYENGLGKSVAANLRMWDRKKHLLKAA